ncbi:hypothetical protein Ahy_A08g040864 [Arachis hypogaea]|uniref:Reverse transcriptase zinc-binding domain-containing protein n=1 Tax=Arachis hypogaea TaxID=3818 RepID=A0A445C0U9_ARAHY|nr:hypothetical protein Ahy_A08g040864 [Arachis hypogaea]
MLWEDIWGRAMINNNRKGKENFKTVIDRVHSKLKGWKSNFLSLAGRITLAQSAISPSVNFEMQNGRPEYKRDTFCQIGDGLSTNFWRDPWVEDINSLLEFATQSISDTESAVWEWTNDKGKWDTSKLKEYLPEDIVAKITASPPPSLYQDEDKIG